MVVWIFSLDLYSESVSSFLLYSRQPSRCPANGGNIWCSQACTYKKGHYTKQIWIWYISPYLIFDIFVFAMRGGMIISLFNFSFARSSRILAFGCHDSSTWRTKTKICILNGELSAPCWFSSEPYEFFFEKQVICMFGNRGGFGHEVKGNEQNFMTRSLPGIMISTQKRNSKY